MSNRFGLNRNIPDAVKKAVRRRCGFGCVICGSAIITYEHFMPPFKDATQHDPNGITLLCGSHQLETTKGILSKESIAHYNSSPYCLRVGNSKHIFDLGNIRPSLILGSVDVSDCGPGIEVDGEVFLRIRPPEKHSSRWRISARFLNSEGSVICEIVDNEIIVSSQNFDFVQQAKSFSIQSPTEELLCLQLAPPKGLIIKHYVLHVKHGKVIIGEDKSSTDRRKIPKEVAATLGESPRFGITVESPTSRQTFNDCRFSFPQGLGIDVLNGSTQFRPARSM